MVLINLTLFDLYTRLISRIDGTLNDQLIFSAASCNKNRGVYDKFYYTN
jgi:hypothetical protein